MNSHELRSVRYFANYHNLDQNHVKINHQSQGQAMLRYIFFFKKNYGNPEVA